MGFRHEVRRSWREKATKGTTPQEKFLVKKDEGGEDRNSQQSLFWFQLWRTNRKHSLNSPLTLEHLEEYKIRLVLSLWFEMIDKSLKKALGKDVICKLRLFIWVKDLLNPILYSLFCICFHDFIFSWNKMMSHKNWDLVLITSKATYLSSASSLQYTSDIFK